MIHGRTYLGFAVGGTFIFIAVTGLAFTVGWYTLGILLFLVEVVAAVSSEILRDLYVPPAECADRRTRYSRARRLKSSPRLPSARPEGSMRTR
jgi:hypothetical protein